MKPKNSIRMKSIAFIMAALFLCAVPDAALSQPANDNFADAIVLTGVSGQITGTNIGATSETGESTAWYEYGKSVWWKWTASETGAFYFDTHGSNFDTILRVYTGPAVGSLTQIAQNYDDGSDNGNSSLAFRANAGTAYYIAVCGGSSGDIVLNWRKANPPANDNFADAIELSGISGQIITGTNIEATREPGEPDYLENSVWYSWTAPETGAFCFSIQSDTDASLTGDVYTGLSVDRLEYIAWMGNLEAETGTRYHIAVTGWGGGNIVLNWRKTNPPANDNFADAIELSGVSGQTTGTTIDATIEPGEGTREDTVWWKWTPPESGIFYFDTNGSMLDTVFFILTPMAACWIQFWQFIPVQQWTASQRSDTMRIMTAAAPA